MSYHQKIECNVSSCAHNCLEDSTCRLDRIMVKPCYLNQSRTPEGDTACGSYFYIIGNFYFYVSKFAMKSVKICCKSIYKPMFMIYNYLKEKR